MRGAVAVDQLKRGVEIEAAVDRELCRQVMRETRAQQPP